jgi:hypothetical protein
MAANEALILFLGDGSFTGDAPFGSVLRGGTGGCSYQGDWDEEGRLTSRFVVNREGIGQAGEDLSL